MYMSRQSSIFLQTCDSYVSAVMSLAHLSVFAAQSRSSDLSNPKLPRLTVSSYSTVHILWYLVSTEMIIVVPVIVVSVHPQGFNLKIESKHFPDWP